MSKACRRWKRKLGRQDLKASTAHIHYSIFQVRALRQVASKPCNFEQVRIKLVDMTGSRPQCGYSNIWWYLASQIVRSDKNSIRIFGPEFRLLACEDPFSTIKHPANGAVVATVQDR